MLGESHRDLEHEQTFDTIEEALLTSCPICGTELEWKLKVVWCDKTELPKIFGASFSCGVDFTILPLDDGGYMTERSDLLDF